MTPSSPLVHWRHPICQRHSRFRRVVGACPVPPATPLEGQLMPSHLHNLVPFGGRGILHRTVIKSSEASVTEIILHTSHFRLFSSTLDCLECLESNRTLRGGYRICSGVLPGLANITIQEYEFESTELRQQLIRDQIKAAHFLPV